MSNVILHGLGLQAFILYKLQGEEVDEVAAQPAWLQEDANGDAAEQPFDGGGMPAMHNPTLHTGPGPSANGASADFIGLGDDEGKAPYANGDSHAQPQPGAADARSGQPSTAAAPAATAATAAPQDPLEDLLALSATSTPAQQEAPKQGDACPV